MEGPLSVPPDRGTIIGRASWKTRHVVIGGATREQTPPTPSSRSHFNRNSPPLSRLPSDGVFLSIYKSKDDTEAIQQYSINSISDCQIQMVAHRKQGPVIPTLVVSLLPDPQQDKARKRRSSRTAGFVAPRESGPTTLMFRYADEVPTLPEWARFIQQLIQPHVPDRAPFSPLTPASPTFVNPFAPRSREPSDTQQRPGSGHGSRPALFKNPSQTHSLRERPMTFSDSPSLRSKRSDLSSQTSMMTQSHMGFHNLAGMMPADLPSPAATIGEYQGEFIEGWTSAQGRSSAVSSPIRGRDSSIGSQIQTQLPPILDSDSPAGPRETILDRAFQLRCIPGSDRDVPGEDKLSSLARFDALMREMDEKRRQREAEETKLKSQAVGISSTRTTGVPPQSAFDEDDDSDSERDSDDDSDSDEMVGEGDVEEGFTSSTPARHALDFISGRSDSGHRHVLTSRGYGIRSPPSYNREALMALSSSGSSPARPQTGYSKTRNRPGMSQRTHSQPHLATMLASSTPLDVPGESEEGTGFSFTPGSPSAVYRNSAEQRHSASSSKRLSFGEFTRRLSSTSSLLIMQTNASGPASSRASQSDMDLQQPPQSPPAHLHHLHPRASPPTPFQLQQPPQSPPPLTERDRCGWRGSVGLFGGADSGFV